MAAVEVCVVEKETVSVDECSENVGKERESFYRRKRSAGESLLGRPMLQVICVVSAIYRRYTFLHRRFT
ncbi:hypothetical protein HAX54_043176, partial [Datura stramonium]|nr:hypothetical protein [Datura stramonium]